jgi:hypothetical protein
MCSRAFPKGIVIPHPQQEVPFLQLIDPEFLFHLYTTHAIAPEDFRSFFLKRSKVG